MHTKTASQLLEESAATFDHACMMVKAIEQELPQLRKVRECAEVVCTVAGANGQISAHDERLVALLNALYESDKTSDDFSGNQPIFVGEVTDDDGHPTHKLYLLPGDQNDIDFKTAKEWAARIGGDLPSRKELKLLREKAPEEFHPDWYWSNAQHASDSDYAWYQDFGDGDQGYTIKDDKLRARAVRRDPIQ